MRPIDADALKDTIMLSDFHGEMGEVFMKIMRRIDETPTVKTEKKKKKKHSKDTLDVLDGRFFFLGALANDECTDADVILLKRKEKYFIYDTCERETKELSLKKIDKFIRENYPDSYEEAHELIEMEKGRYKCFIS